MNIIRICGIAQIEERHREDVPERQKRLCGAGLVAGDGERLAARLPGRAAHGGLPAEDEPGVRRRGHRHRAHGAVQNYGTLQFTRFTIKIIWWVKVKNLGSFK